MATRRTKDRLALIRLGDPEDTADSLTNAFRTRRAAIAFLRQVLTILEARS